MKPSGSSGLAAPLIIAIVAFLLVLGALTYYVTRSVAVHQSVSVISLR
jgi:hypothetical protein